MPKFEYTSEFSVKDALEAMGMTDAFSGSADFSGMTGDKDLYIKDVVHKAFISVDEAGTEAAAASAVIMDRLSLPLEPAEVNLDHPFIYLIRDIQTGTILFMGSVVNPAG
jgi:serpin B